MSTEPVTTAVTVTYADRVDLCATTVRAALAAGAAGCVVVGNGLTDEVSDRLSASLSGLPVRMVHLATNKGSAGGFTAGLAATLSKPGDLVWVLDDDNHAAESALHELLAARARLIAARPGSDPALLAHRPDDVPQRRLREGGDVDAVYGPPGSVLSFDLLSRRRRRRSGAVADVVAVPYGPYGGLLVSRAALERIDPPRQDFHLYEDDSEFTWRLARATGLHVVFRAIVRDADGKWSGRVDEGSGPVRLLRAGDRRRRWFGVRNRVAFDLQRVSAEGGAARFILNIVIWAATLAASGLRERRPADVVDVLRALGAGLALHRAPSATGRPARWAPASQASRAA